MKIAHVAPILYNIPNGTDGPTVACTNLHLGLLKLHQNATLFGFKNSRVPGKVDYLFPKEFSSLKEYVEGSSVMRTQMILAHYAYAFSKAKNFDIYQTHLLQSTLFYASLSKTPTVIKISNYVSEFFAEMMLKFNTPNLHFVAISNAQKSTLPESIKNVSVIYEGVNTDVITPKYKKKNFALFVGRLTKMKRPHVAIDACIKAKQPLVILGKMPGEEQKEDFRYFQTFIKHRLKHPLVQYKGLVSRKEAYKYFQDAKCLVFPTSSKEPFGLVFIEALASGTPVVAMEGGVASEIITKEVGFLAKKPSEIPALLGHVSKIDPAKCREYAVKKFSYTNIAEQYVNLYQKLLKH